MRRIHLAVGVLTVVVFLASGQYLRFHSPPLTAVEDGTRLLYRSRHIYILASGLVNLVLGLYVRARVAGWRKTTQAVGSALLALAPILLLLAFLNEPGRGLHADLWQSRFGLFALFGGSLLHAIASIGNPAEKRQGNAAGTEVA